MIGNRAVQPQPAEPTVGQIEVDIVAQPPLRADPEAIADNQHPDHQLGIDRRATRLAVVGFKMRPNLRQIDKPVDLAKQMIVGDMTLEAEAVEQRLLHHPPLAHHRPNPPQQTRENPTSALRSSGVFQHNPPKAVVPAHRSWIEPRHSDRVTPIQRREASMNRG